MFSLIALENQNKVDPRRAKKANLVQYGYKKVKLIPYSVFQNTCAWEQQELKNTKKQRKKVRSEVYIYGKKYSGHDPTVPPGSLLTEAVNEIPNEPSLHLYAPSTTPWKQIKLISLTITQAILLLVSHK